MQKSRSNSFVLAGAIAAVLCSAQPAAKAISLAYETAGPWGAAGTAFTSGPIEFIFNGVASGTIYQPFGPVGTVVGSASPGTGVGLMDGLAGQINPTNAIGSEDQYGIVQVIEIRDINTNAVIWSPAGKNQQLVGSFYGGTDFWGRQDQVGPNLSQTTAMTGFSINLYEQTPQLPLPNLAGTTPADRGTGVHVDGSTPNAADFPLWTEDQNGAALPNLTLAFSLKGVTGFLDPSAGATVGLDQNVEAISTFVNSVGAQGNVQGFLEVDPNLGSGALIDNNEFVALFNNNLADARFTFTQQTLPSANPWDVSINGPADTAVPASTSVPEPGTAFAGLACVWSVFGARRRKAAKK